MGVGTGWPLFLPCYPGLQSFVCLEKPCSKDRWVQVLARVRPSAISGGGGGGLEAWFALPGRFLSPQEGLNHEKPPSC